MNTYPYCLPSGLNKEQLEIVDESVSSTDFRSKYNTVSINALNAFTGSAQSVNNFCQNTDLITRILNSEQYKYNNILGYNKLTDVTGSNNIFIGTNQTITNLNNTNTITIGYDLTPISDVIQIGFSSSKGLRLNKDAYILANSNSSTTISSTVSISSPVTISSSVTISSPVTVSTSGITVNNMVLQTTVTTLPVNLISNNALYVSLNSVGYYIPLYTAGTVNTTYSITTPTANVVEGGSVTFTITTTNVSNGTVLYWSVAPVIGSVQASDFSDNTLTGQVSITNNSASITRTIASDLNIGETESFQILLRTGSTTGPVVATSSAVSIAEPLTTYSITSNTVTGNEGSVITFTINTTNVPNNTILYWTTETVLGDIQSSDFTDNLLTGTVSINNSVGSLTRTFRDESVIEFAESFKINIRTNSITGTVVATSPIITITPPTPFYTVTPNSTSVAEGSTVSFIVTTSNVPNNTKLYWDIENVTGSVDASDFTVSNGEVTIFSNSGNFFTQIITDSIIETNNVFRVRLRTESSTGSVVATSDNITINDPPTTYTVTSNKSSVNEGSSVRFTIRTTNVPNNTILYWTLSGRQVIGAGGGNDLPSNQITSGMTTGNMTITNSIAQVLIDPIYFSPPRTDFRYFCLIVRTGSVSGPIVASSDIIVLFQEIARVYALPGPYSMDIVPRGATRVLTWVVGRGSPFGNSSAGTSGGMILKEWNVAENDMFTFRINNSTGEVGLTHFNGGISVSAYGGLFTRDFYKIPTPVPFSVGGRGPFDTHSPIQMGGERPYKPCSTCLNQWVGGQLVENFNSLNTALIKANYPYIRSLDNIPAFGEAGLHTITDTGTIVDSYIPGIGGGATNFPASALSGGVVLWYSTA